MAAAKRISLTKAQLGTEIGTELLNLLVSITADGELSLGEVEQLKSWVERNQQFGQGIPAISWLRDLIGDILRDGRITRDERVELVAAIERVLPKEQRLQAQESRRRAETVSEGREGISFDKDEVDREPATEKQVKYIIALGGKVSSGLTKWAAMDLIDELRAGAKSVSNRQMMVLRFWDKVRLAKNGREGVSEWLDEWYGEDFLRLEAWELWKSESNDTGLQDNPNRVPVGAGYRYLAMVQRGAGSAEGVSRAKRFGCGSVVTIIVIAIIAKIVWDIVSAG